LRLWYIILKLIAFSLNKEVSLSLPKSRLSLLNEDPQSKVLLGIKRGIEKESLRVTPSGTLAQTPHSPLLGSALTHPQITTDFSEALLEFITPPLTDAGEVLQTLEDIHRFTYSNIGDEILWTSSMPCQLNGESNIPVGEYGSSNIGAMKHTYRLGLGHRYGRLMQTIAGIHYNFSVPDELMQTLREKEGSILSFQDFKTENYFSLIRNFRRHFWLLLYLFGASSAICRSFVKGRDHQLVPFDADKHSLYLPYATSIRMSDLGYQSEAQDSLVVCYNSLQNYIKTLRSVLIKPYPSYESIGLKNSNGDYKQLNLNILQIENELYSPIRPKRSTCTGQTPLQALREEGVEYIEVRCIDLNPFLPLGIDRAQMDFLDIFLLTCFLSKSAPTDQQEYNHILENQRLMVSKGRSPGLMLHSPKGMRSFSGWSHSIFEEMRPVAQLLDKQHQTSRYQTALEKLELLIDNPSLTPSAQILQTMKQTGKTYYKVAMEQALKNREHFLEKKLSPEITKKYTLMATESLSHQKKIEEADTLNFDEFLKAYRQQCNFKI